MAAADAMLRRDDICSSDASSSAAEESPGHTPPASPPHNDARRAPAAVTEPPCARRAGAPPPAAGGWLRADDCTLAELRGIVEVATEAADYPLAAAVESNIVIYDRRRLALSDPALARALEEEMQHALRDGPGIVVVKGAFEEGVVDRVTAAFDMIIDDEARAAPAGRGDHFGKAGANSRVWNALEKLADRDPDAFVDYYSNEVVALASRCWLGPNYQVTSQVNVVRPGGQPQAMHRDYHLGFQTNAEAERYPAHVHDICPMLTLQCAVAHCDMPVETGPTLFLPHSQKYRHGYLAWRKEEFKAYFAEKHVQLPLGKGDFVCFNPAVLHGAGGNRTEATSRTANLLQVSSAFGRAMETVDRTRLALTTYPSILKHAGRPEWTGDLTRNAIAATAEGYPFPTNLDLDAPVGGLAPRSHADIVSVAVAESWPLAELDRELRACDTRHRS